MASNYLWIGGNILLSLGGGGGGIRKKMEMFKFSPIPPLIHYERSLNELRCTTRTTEYLLESPTHIYGKVKGEVGLFAVSEDESCSICQTQYFFFPTSDFSHTSQTDTYCSYIHLLPMYLISLVGRPVWRAGRFSIHSKITHNVR